MLFKHFNNNNLLKVNLNLFEIFNCFFFKSSFNFLLFNFSEEKKFKHFGYLSIIIRSIYKISFAPLYPLALVNFLSLICLSLLNKDSWVMLIMVALVILKSRHL